MTINDSATSSKRLSSSIQPLVYIQLLLSNFIITCRAYLSESMMAISKQFVFGLSTQEKLHVLIKPVEKNNPRRRALDRNTQTKRAFESMLNYLKFESNHSLPVRNYSEQRKGLTNNRKGVAVTTNTNTNKQNRRLAE